MGTSFLGMDDTLGDALAVKVGEKVWREKSISHG
jgi:hypothetical protein